MLKMLKYFIEQSWLLVVSAFIFGLLIAVTYASWQPRIEQNEIDKLNRRMSELIADANFSPILQDAKVNLAKGKKAKVTIYRATSPEQQCLGYCFNAEGPGFADKIKLVIAVDADFETFSGYSVLASNETPGFGDKIKFEFFRSQFKGAPAKDLTLLKMGDAGKIDDEIIAISGATVSSEAVIKIFNNYIEQIKNLSEKIRY